MSQEHSPARQVGHVHRQPATGPYRIQAIEPAEDANDDIVAGAAAIQKFLNVKSRRQVHWLIERGQLPGSFRLGRSLFLSKKKFYEGVSNAGAT